MAKKDKKEEISSFESSRLFLPSEWAKMQGKKAINYLWHDKNMGLIDEEEFNKINL